jgi:tetratricopeptide (TPR) repeat protein
MTLSKSLAVILAAVSACATAAWADSTREMPSPPPARAPAPVAAPAASVPATLDGAQARIDAGDFQGAIPILAQIVKAEPRNADALNLMGYSSRKTGQTDVALQYYNSALALMPRHLGANEYLGELYVELGQFDKAKERLVVLRAACGEDCKQTKQLEQAIQSRGGRW